MTKAFFPGRIQRHGIRPVYLSSPTIGAFVSRASTLAKARNASHALTELDRLPHEAVATYQPYWALRFNLLKDLGRTEEAEKALQLAIVLTEDPSVRAYLLS